jgi:hypothetical protein
VNRDSASHRPLPWRCRLIGWLVLITLMNYPAFPQTRTAPESSCVVGLCAPAYGFWIWAPSSRIKVYILAADFSRDEIPFLLAPLQSWDAVWDSSGSRVRFDYQGTTAAPVNCENCLTIMRERVFDKKARHGSELRAHSEQGTQIITYASIVIDPAIINPKALTNAVAHELGHSFGLLDCYNCKDRSTVMNKLKSMNASNEMAGPTLCDVAQVKNAYRELRVRVSPAPVALDSATDDDEEPVEDDTPLVVPAHRD